MKIFSWNVNGIRAVVKKGEFDKFIKKYNPDILCLQETKIDAIQLAKWRGTAGADQSGLLSGQSVAKTTSRSEKSRVVAPGGSQPASMDCANLTAEQGQAVIDYPEYQEFWNSSKAKKGYSGTAIFAKIKPLSVISDIPEEFVKAGGLVLDDYGHSNDEGRMITAEFNDFYVVTAYTPNAKDDLSRIPLRQQWDKALTLYCAALQKDKPVVYCGDMNVAHTEDDLANPKPNRGKKGFTEEERSGFDNWLAAGFVDTLRIFKQGNGYYTWWSHFANARARNVGWRIDYFLVSKSLKDKLKSAEIHADQMGSDHCPISIELDL